MSNTKTSIDPLAWTHGFHHVYNHKFIEACNQCEQCKCNGMSRSDAEDIMVSKGLEGKDLESVLDHVYSSNNKDDKSLTIMIVPTEYADIAPLIEKRLAEFGAKKFVSMLTDSEMPIIEASEKFKNHLVKICEKALESPTHYNNHLHEEISPYIEEAMLNSVLEAENNSASINHSADNKYSVKLSNNRKASVDLSEGTSDSDRFVKGNFGHFGIADEFLIKAHDEMSPCLRMSKIIA